jgi:soluble lytic murein transglycosylase-like protein
MNRPTRPLVRLAAAAAIALALAAPLPAAAGTQVEEQLQPSVATGLARSIADQPVPSNYASRAGIARWLADMSQRLVTRIPDPRERIDVLATVHYEATRAGLDPQLVLGVIHLESGFKKYALSTAGARGYMQVMPFWTRLIGSDEHNLFQLRTNLRYGCVILRHYLDVENGDLYRALGRYNGSLGRDEYPVAVLHAMQRYSSPLAVFAVPLGASIPR